MNKEQLRDSAVTTLTVDESVDWRDRVTLTVTETGGILGVCRNTAYTAVKTGEIPSINLGGRIAVPVATLRRKLGEIA
jgi:Helix-turn-helix domain